jgi:hypothetical protein
MNIHPELRSIKAHTIPKNRWVLAVMQNLLSAVNAMHRRKFKAAAIAASSSAQNGVLFKLARLQ